MSKEKPHTAHGDEKSRLRAKSGMFAALFGMCVNLCLFAAKLTTGIIFGSIAIMADALNNLSDLGNSAVTMIGFKISTRPADREHPFGHGRMEYMSAFAVSISIILVGVELVRSSAEKIFSPELPKTGAAVYIVLVLSIILKLVMGVTYLCMNRRIKSPAISAAKADSFTDVAATGAVLISYILFDAFGINTDAYVGFCVSAVIIYTGIRAAKDTLNPLLGQPPDKGLADSVKQIALTYSGILNIHSLAVHSYGSGHIFASMHAEVPHDMGLVECHEMIDRCEREIGEKLGIHMLIHVDPTGTDDSETIKIREGVCAAVAGIDADLTVQDFRLIKEDSSLRFDLFVPLGKCVDPAELCEEAASRVKAQFGEYDVKVNVVPDM